MCAFTLPCAARLNAPDGFDWATTLNLWVQDANRYRHSREAPSVMSQSSTLDKAAVRRHLRQARKGISLQDRQAAAWKVIHTPGIQRILRPGRKIALYVPMGSEFPTWPLLLLALQRRCQVYLPHTPTRGRQLGFVRLNEDSQWTFGPYQIPVPVHPEWCSPKQLDAVFVPLVGFDRRLARMGQGGGFYDYTFAFRRARRHWRKPLLIGLAFACQEYPQLPLEPWDLQLDCLISEREYLRRAN